MNNLPKVVTHLCPEHELNPRFVDRKSNALPVAPPAIGYLMQMSSTVGVSSLDQIYDMVYRVCGTVLMTDTNEDATYLKQSWRL